MGSVKLASIDSPEETNAGGYGQKILIAPKRWIATAPNPTTTPTTPGDEVTTTGAFTFKTAGDLGWTAGTPGFLEFNSTYDVNTLKSETNMNRHASGDMMTFESLMSGMNKDLIGTLKNMSAQDFIVLVKDSNDVGTDKWVQIGVLDFPALVKGPFDGGVAGTDARKGFKLTISAFGLSIMKHEPTAAPTLYDPVNP